MTHPDPEVEAMDRWLGELFSVDERAEIAALKAQVLKLEDALAKAVIEIAYWRQRATRNAP